MSRMPVPSRHTGICRAAASRDPSKKRATKPAAKDAGALGPESTDASEAERNPRSREQGLSRSAAGTPEPVEFSGALSTSSGAGTVAQGGEQPPSEEAVKAGEAAQELVSSAEAAGAELRGVAEEGGQVAEEVAGAAEDAVTELKGAAEEGGQEVVGAAEDAVTELKGAAAEAGQAVREAVDETNEAVKGRLTGAVQELKRRGQNYDATQRAVLEESVSLTSLPVAPPGGASAVAARDHLRLRLLACVAGTDRGFAVSASQGAQVAAAAEALAAAGGPVNLGDIAAGGANAGQQAAGELAGLWRLVYSSGFASTGSTGGLRPGLPLGLLPAQLGQVYQGISDASGRLDNIVTLRRPALPNLLPFLPPNEPAVATLTLKHTYTVVAPDTVEIRFIGTDANLEGGVAGLLSAIPEIQIPELPEALRPPERKQSPKFSFRVTYLDEDVRITKGDRGELRVFLRT